MSMVIDGETLEKQLASALTEEKFRQWLAQQAPNDVVGTAGDAGRCPLATYLMELFPEYYFTVNHAFIDVETLGYEEVATMDTPLWAGAFTCYVDAMNHLKIKTTDAQVALKIMNDNKESQGVSYQQQIDNFLHA